MSTDTHIKFDGVEGESTHADHKGEIMLLSWSWGVNNSVNISNGGMGVGKAVPQDIIINKKYDKASPVLSKKCCQGVHFPTAVLTCRKSGEGQKDFLKITLKEVYISSVQNSAGADGEINETVSLAYGEIEFAYKPQDGKGGLGGDVKLGWNPKTTKVT